MKTVLCLVIVGLLCWAAHPVFAQREVEPNDLKISPNKYRNASVVLKDIFINYSAGIPVSLSQAGYTSQKYISFGCRQAGIRCFMRRSTANEEVILKLRPGDRITVYGRVKQPKVTVRKNTRAQNRVKLDIYVIEVSKVEPGWTTADPS